MAVTGVASPWCGRDGSMVAVRFGGDPCGFPSRCPASFPAPILIGLFGGPRGGASMLVWISSWQKQRKGGVVGDSRRVKMQAVDRVSFPASGPIFGGRLRMDCVDIFRSEGSIAAYDRMLPPGQWSLLVELFPSSFIDVLWSLPVVVLPGTASCGGLVLLDTIFSEAFLSFSLLLRFVCVFTYFYCSRKISVGWIVCYSLAMGTDQLVWVCAQAMVTDQLVWVCYDGGSPAVVILSVSWCWIVCYSQALGTDQLV